MLRRSSEIPIESNGLSDNSGGRRNWWMLFLFPSWVFVCFITAQALLVGAMWLLKSLQFPLESINQSALSALLAALIYIITLSIVVALPWLIRKHRVSKFEVGLTRFPTWTDILITPAGLIVYFIFSSVLIVIATKVVPLFDVNQLQGTGFGQLSLQYEYLLAFATLVIVAPVAEEILFRGYLYGKLKKYVPVWVAILATSLIFGAFHGAWNLAIDTFALSIILCLLRESTGSIWSSILLHMLKNGIAFYLLFIYPSLLVH